MRAVRRALRILFLFFISILLVPKKAQIKDFFICGRLYAVLSLL